MNPSDEQFQFVGKWDEEIALHNFTQVPNLLLRCQGHLGISDGELLTLIHLLTFKYRADSKIFPTIATLTKFSENGYSTVQRRLRQLEKKGFVVRKQRFNTSNQFDLTPCIEKLTLHSRSCATTGAITNKRVGYTAKVTGLHPSFSINKEDEALIRLNQRESRKQVSHEPSWEQFSEMGSGYEY